MGDEKKSIHFPAVKLQHSHGRVLYSFPLDGKMAFQFAAISKAKREDGKFIGHQRGAVTPHIRKITNYIETSGSFIPNSVIIAFDDSVSFIPQDNGVHGTLVVPYDPDNPCGFIIDGQQRLLAIQDATVPSFPVFASAFIYQTEAELLEQFMNVNSAKSIKADLIFEMSAYSTNRPLRFISQIVEKLNFNEESPLYHRLKMSTHPDGDIAANSFRYLIENSIKSQGFLGMIAEEVQSEEDFVEIAAACLIAYFSAVKLVWDELWFKKPKDSRLLHGVGVNGLGRLMDEIYRYYTTLIEPTDPKIPPMRFFVEELLDMKPHCHWASGHWTFANGMVRHWNELQNLSSDKKLLNDHLALQYGRVVEEREEEDSSESSEF